jgi:threonyl-tRNA synthetase
MAILPINDKVEGDAEALQARLKQEGFRVELFLKGQLNKKIVEARSQKIPYLVIMGPRDVQNGTVSIRLRDDTQLDPMPVEDFIRMAKQLVESKSQELVINPNPS